MHRIRFLQTAAAVLLSTAAWAAPAIGQTSLPSAKVARLLDSLPPRAKIGQIVMPWIPGSSIENDPGWRRTLRWLDSAEVGGVIISVGEASEMAVKLNALQRRSRLPLLVASDLEGGTAIRLRTGTPFPTNMGVAAGGKEADAYLMGEITAREGRAVGIHLAFSPVADINNNPENPIINTRSFGADPHAVGRFATATIRGIQNQGMLATVKHFPGHGDTGVDSHISLPVIAADRTRLDSVELVPFRAAIAAGVAAVMSAHIALPNLDPVRQGRRPATLSPTILSGLLRDSLGFKGLVITDALDMGALVKEYGAGEAAVLAFLAGADILLQPTDPFITVQALQSALDSGRISMARLNQSVARILSWKEQLGLFENREVAIPALNSVVGSSRHRTAALEVTRRSTVLVTDRDNTLTTVRSRPSSLVLVTYGENIGNRYGDVMTTHLERQGHRVLRVRVTGQSVTTATAELSRAITGGAIPIMVVSVRATSGRGSLGIPEPIAAMLRSAATRTPSILVSLGSPYIGAAVPEASAYLIGWTANSLTEQAIAEALSGGAITGRLPIPIPAMAALGTGIIRSGR